MEKKKRGEGDFYLHDYANRVNIVNICKWWIIDRKFYPRKSCPPVFGSVFRLTVIRNLLIPWCGATVYRPLVNKFRVHLINHPFPSTLLCLHSPPFLSILETTDRTAVIINLIVHSPAPLVNFSPIIFIPGRVKYEKGGFFEINVDAGLFFIEPCFELKLRFRHHFVNLPPKKKNHS